MLMVCPFLALSGSQMGRWAGIMADAIGFISAIWWMPFYPIWSLTYIVIGFLRWVPAGASTVFGPIEGPDGPTNHDR